MTEYPYASGALIETPHTYFYSAYGGVDFLRAWAAQRSTALADLGAPAAPPSSAVIAGGPAHWPVETAQLLDHLLASLNARSDDPGTMLWLARLIKKFEATKRVHAAYREGFIAVDKTKRNDLELYVRLAEVFDAAYVNVGSVPALNALLKVIDILCSQTSTLAPGLSGRLARLIENERGHITRMANEREVTW